MDSGERLLSVADQRGLLEDPSVRRLVLAAGISQNDGLQEAALKAVIGKSVQNWQYPFDERTWFGEVSLGETFRGGSFGLSQDDFTKHLLAVGQSGSGKTTLFYNLMEELGRPFWAFDLKQDYRHLVEGLDGLLVLPWSEIKLNPLRPPRNVSPRRWAQVFAEIFGHSTALLSGSKNYLLKKIIELYRLYGLFDSFEEPFPSLHELELLIRKERLNYVRKASDYRDTLLNRLESMNLVAGTVLDCSKGYGAEELLDRDVVFEFDGLSRDVQNFLMEILFAYVYEYRLAQNQRDSGLNHAFFLDEGKRVFSVYKERQDASGIPEIDELTAKMREFGEGLVVADQEASKLTDSIKANTYTKALLSTGDQKQFQAVAESMNLSKRQMEFAQELDTGEAVVQVGNRSPVPVKLDNYRLDKNVSDKELRKQQAENWEKLSHSPRETTPDFREKIGPSNSNEEQGSEIPSDPRDPNSEVQLSSSAERLLEDVVNDPFRPLTERYSDFSSRYKGNKAKNELVDEGVAVERRIHQQEDKRKLLQLTEQGRKYAEKDLDLEVKHGGRGGIIHQYWQHKIRDLFEEAGWDAFLEKFDADIYINMGNTELAVEVAMGDKPREIQHVEKHLNRDFTIWIACRNKEIQDGLQQRLQENGLDPDQVVFRLLRRFNDVESLSL
ncbi:ATP-binding protein [Halobellus rubicundus]|uniref:ATP-binding protein n=1 Tax=Halobellus rubicundus TaxID=2996466 RepID=A0ABD5M9S3_9EURY